MCTAFDEVVSCYAATCLCPLHLLLMWTNENKPYGFGGVTWLSSSLPRGMLVGPTCQVSLVVGAHPAEVDQ
jgi:hypothetical protein